MIKNITLENFQSHVSTTLEPAPAGKLTVIVGASDSGKTAIVRALRWLFYNTPQGTDFININADSAKVTVKYSDETRVVRERHRRGRNRYEVGEERYESFGLGVPIEVQQATGVRPVTVGDAEFNLNLAEQLEGPFLGKSVSAIARAKVLGKLAGLEEIDYAQKQLNADLRRGRQNESTLVAEIEDLEGQIAQFDYLPKLARRIKSLERLVSTIEAYQERRGYLVHAKEKLTRIETLILEARQASKRWQGLDKAAQMVERACELLASREEIRSKGQELVKVRNQVKLCTQVVRQWAGLGEAEKLTQDVAELVAQREEVVSLATKLRQTTSSIKHCEQVLKDRSNEITKLEKAHHDQLVGLGICPLCGQPVK